MSRRGCIAVVGLIQGFKKVCRFQHIYRERSVYVYIDIYIYPYIALISRLGDLRSVGLLTDVQQLRAGPRWEP